MRERVQRGGPPLTRWEHRFLGTCKEDTTKYVYNVFSQLDVDSHTLNRLVPFALIILIAEEVIPLVVMYAPFILPSTCILPAQKQRIDEKRREKQQASAVSMLQTFERIRNLAANRTNIDLKHLLDSPGLAAISGCVLQSFPLP
jgi:LETM1 and EF-hand domain-containing protein 1, mitochondrial